MANRWIYFSLFSGEIQFHDLTQVCFFPIFIDSVKVCSFFSAIIVAECNRVKYSVNKNYIAIKPSKDIEKPKAR